MGANLAAWLEEVSSAAENTNSRKIILDFVRSCQERAFKAKDQSMLVDSQAVSKALGINQQNASQQLKALFVKGLLKRLGKGCAGRPFRYYVPEGEK